MKKKEWLAGLGLLVHARYVVRYLCLAARQFLAYLLSF